MPRIRAGDRDRIDVNAAWRETVRTLKSGEQRRVILDVEADIVGADFGEQNVRAATAEVAQELAQSFIDDVRAVYVPASPATLKRRQSAHRAASDERAIDQAQRGARSSLWVKRQYAGGRIGYLPPDPHSIRLLNDSGRLTRVVVNPRKSSRGTSSWTMNFPANRLSPEFFAPGKLEWLIETIKRLVPAARGQYEGDRATMLRRAERRSLKRLNMIVPHKQSSSIFKLFSDVSRLAAEAAKGLRVFR